MALYCKIVCELPDDPKIIDAGSMAELLYLRCTLRCRALLTDGVIDRRQLARWGVGIKGNLKNLAARLVEVGLWEEHPAGWRIPERVWTKFNPTAAEVQAMRDEEAERKRVYRKGKVSQDCPNGTPGGVPPLSQGCPGQPEPEPEGEPEREGEITPPNPPQGGEKPSSKSKRFSPPTAAEVAAYCAERKNGIDAEAFIAHYEANGWRRGQGAGIKIQDWKACVRTWEDKRNTARAPPPPPANQAANRKSAEDALRQLNERKAELK